MQVPAATVVTAESATVQADGVSEVNRTGSPEDACADKVTGVPTVVPGGCPNVIVCAAGPAWAQTWNDRFTWAAASGGFPSWKAVIVQVPADRVVTAESATVHTDDVSDLNNTGSPGGEAEADMAIGVPTVTLGG